MARRAYWEHTGGGAGGGRTARTSDTEVRPESPALPGPERASRTPSSSSTPPAGRSAPPGRAGRSWAGGRRGV